MLIIITFAFMIIFFSFIFSSTLNTIKSEVRSTENNLNNLIIKNENNRNKDFKILNQRIDDITEMIEKIRGENNER